MRAGQAGAAGAPVRGDGRGRSPGRSCAWAKRRCSAARSAEPRSATSASRTDVCTTSVPTPGARRPGRDPAPERPAPATFRWHQPARRCQHRCRRARRRAGAGSTSWPAQATRAATAARRFSGRPPAANAARTSSGVPPPGPREEVAARFDTSQQIVRARDSSTSMSSGGMSATGIAPPEEDVERTSPTADLTPAARSIRPESARLPGYTPRHPERRSGPPLSRKTPLARRLSCFWRPRRLAEPLLARQAARTACARHQAQIHRAAASGRAAMG